MVRKSIKGSKTPEPPKPATVICPNCRSEIEQGHDYCEKCGASLFSSVQNGTDDNHYTIG